MVKSDGIELQRVLLNDATRKHYRVTHFSAKLFDTRATMASFRRAARRGQQITRA